MWYVIRRARYELNKECLPESNYTITAKPSLSPSKSLHLNGFHHSTSVVDIITDPASLDILEDKNENKFSHKRAKSASAILIDINHS